MTNPTDKFIIASFRQFGANNCATVAIIKAALIRYGVDGVFRKIKENKRTIEITLRNRKKIKISRRTIVEVNRKNGMRFKKYKSEKYKKITAALKTRVELGFGVMVVCMSRYGFMGEKYSLAEALMELTYYGINTDDAWRLLGLPDPGKILNLKNEDISFLEKKRAVLLYNNAHAVVLSGGFWDYYGNCERLNDKRPKINKKSKAKFWYKLR